MNYVGWHSCKEGGGREDGLCALVLRCPRCGNWAIVDKMLDKDCAEHRQHCTCDSHNAHGILMNVVKKFTECPT
jgi:hypothetical protein